MKRISASMNMDLNRIQQYITESPWDPFRTTGSIADRLMPKYTSEEGILVVDDTGMQKQGTHSVGTQRQYSGTLGKVGNCQVGVNVIYVNPGRDRNADLVPFPLGMELYLPESWMDNPSRRKKVGISSDAVFRTKHEIALGIIAQARQRGIPYKCVVSDCGYGNDSGFREQLRLHHDPYALAVDPDTLRVIDADAPLVYPGSSQDNSHSRKHPAYPKEIVPYSPSQLARWTTNAEWELVRWSEGTKGPLEGLFYRRLVRVVHPQKSRRATDEVGWLLLEKHPDGLKAYLCVGLDSMTLEELVKIVHQRWAVEQFYEDTKQMLGLDEFQGRSWLGWHHHMAMVCLAYVFLSIIRAESPKGAPLPPFSEVLWFVVLEVITNRFMTKEGFRRPRAARIARDIMTGYMGMVQPTK